jgi:hypothetical protein
MKPTMSLRTKVLSLAVINAVLLVAALVWFAQTQLTQNIGSVLLGESRGRIMAVAMQLGRELADVPAKEHDGMLARYSKAHGVTFYLFHRISRRNSLLYQ